MRGGVIELANVDHLNGTPVTGLTFAGGQLHYTGDAGAITLPATINASTSAIVSPPPPARPLTFGGLVSGGTTGITALTVAGPGTVVLTKTGAGGNNFAGNILVNGGGMLEIQISNTGTTATDNDSANGWERSSGLGAGHKSVILDDGTFRLGPGKDYKPDNVNNTKTFRIDAGGGTIDVVAGRSLQLGTSGKVDGAGDLTKTGPGILLLGSSPSLAGRSWSAREYCRLATAPAWAPPTRARPSPTARSCTSLPGAIKPTPSP